jgi:hypothetical protein
MRNIEFWVVFIGNLNNFENIDFGKEKLVE